MKLRIFAVAVIASLTVAGQARTFVENFSDDHGLDESRWSTQCDILDALASVNQPRTTEIRPLLNFGADGMTMSGVTERYQFAGIASHETFSPPFTLNATVEGVVANGNAFAIYLVSDDLKQWFNIQGNLNPENRQFYGIRMSYTSYGLMHHGAYLHRKPAINEPYTFRVSVGIDGKASVWLMNGSSTVASKSGLMVGTGPFHLILAQREGSPQMAGPNAAIWKDVSIVPSPAAISLQPGPINVFRPIFSELELSNLYQLQISGDLNNWTNFGPSFTATNSHMIYPEGWQVKGTDHLFFRLQPLP